MRRSLRRWLFHRRIPTIRPLCQRTSWDDFAGRMRRAITIDMLVLMGEVTLAELELMQVTRPLPACDAETLAEPRFWGWHECETVANDEYATLPDLTVELAKR